MRTRSVEFSRHAITRMFERSITRANVIAVIEQGEVIMDYPDDSPYPSCLLLGFAGQRPLHVVIAYDDTSEACYVITAYIPSSTLWDGGFRKRIK